MFSACRDAPIYKGETLPHQRPAALRTNVRARDEHIPIFAGTLFFFGILNSFGGFGYIPKKPSPSLSLQSNTFRRLCHQPRSPTHAAIRSSNLRYLFICFFIRLPARVSGEQGARGGRRDRKCREGADVPHDAADEQPQGQVDYGDGEGRSLREPGQRRGVCVCAQLCAPVLSSRLMCMLCQVRFVLP